MDNRKNISFNLYPDLFWIVFFAIFAHGFATGKDLQALIKKEAKANLQWEHFAVPLPW